jgi:acetylornithine deacetylase/succinyl-diaminopimelate desuccinylase-like protein
LVVVRFHSFVELMSNRTSCAIASFLCFSFGAAAVAQTPINWDALTRETVGVLTDYIKVNTTNPPGNEIEAARFLKRILDREGIEARILDTVELAGRRGANLYARLRSNGKKKAIALVHHMDVVPVTQTAWTVDGFGGVVKDGYVWGRGAIDMKGFGIVQLMTMIAIKRSGMPLTRDIVFIANADEEMTSSGAAIFVQRHPDLLRDVEYLMTEGGGNEVHDGKLEYYGVGIAEKRTYWQKLTVAGTPSHASRPTKLNPVPRLVAALDKIAKYETPLHVTPGVEKFFRDISSRYPEPRRAWLADVKTSLANPKAREWILGDVYWNAILRNTISLTMLSGSPKTNVIAAEATADIDIRLLPDTDPAAFLATLKRIVNDTAVHFTATIQPKTPLENPIETDLFRAIERASRDRDPGALVTTPMLTAATDRPTYRALGIISYGFDPFKLEASELQKGMHGNDERISVANIGFGVKYLYDVLRYAQ